MKKPPTKRPVAKELPLMLSNSLIFVVMNVMLLIPIYPINRQIRLETKARTSHKPKETRNSEVANLLPAKALHQNEYNTLVARQLFMFNLHVLIE